MGANLATRAAGVAARVLVALALAVLAFFGLGPHTGLYRTETVLSGSMVPRFSPGDVVVVTPEPSTSLRVGQVITYNIPIGNHEPVTHRVIAILHGGPNPVIRTKGDANNAPDPWTARLAGPTVWRERWTIPSVGWVIEWLRRPSARYPLAIGLPVLLCLLWLREIWTHDDRETAHHAPDPA
jgi:signal peptidase I